MLRLLLLEDDRAVARALTRVLELKGFEVEHLVRCSDVHDTTGHFHCGVFDVSLPDGDGIAVAAELLHSGRCKGAVFFSGSFDPNVAARASSYGHFVHKSEGISELGAAIAAAIAEMHRRPRVSDVDTRPDTTVAKRKSPRPAGGESS